MLKIGQSDFRAYPFINVAGLAFHELPRATFRKGFAEVYRQSKRTNTDISNSLDLDSLRSLGFLASRPPLTRSQLGSIERAAVTQDGEARHDRENRRQGK